jgi:hypothetical protein
MRIHDVLTESDLQQIDEAPAGMGMFGRAGRKIASKLGHSKSTGVLDAGNDAIALRKELNRYLGKTGQQPNSEALIGFLTSAGYPTQGVMKIIQSHGGTPTGVLGKGSANISAFKDRMAGNKAAAGETPPKVEPTGTIEVPPAGDKPAADTDAAPAATDTPAGFGPKTDVKTTTPTGEPIPTGGIPNTSMDPLDAIKKNAGIPATPAADTPTAAKAAPGPKIDPEQAAALKAKLSGGGGIAKTTGGGFSAAKKKFGAAFENFDLELEEEDAAKVLPNSVIDQALLRAVQDSYKLGGGQNINTGASGTTPGADDEKPGAMSRFGSNFKAGMSGAGGAAAGGTDKAASADVANTLKTAAGGEPVQSTTNQGIDTLLKNAGLLK